MPALLAATSPWSFAPHPEVWMLVGTVIALGLYVTRVIAPKVPASHAARREGEGSSAGGPAVTTAHKRWFALGVVLLWLASDWPLHDLSEQYLYFLHMVQHMVLTLVIPPVFWLATPRWLARLAVPADGRFWPVLRRLAHPVVAAVLFNALTVATHWTVVVNTSVEVAAVHYTVHLLIVTSAVLMWIPVCGPWPELRLGPAGSCVYLFTQSIVPTVPGAWITMAEQPVYSVYDHATRLWGIDVITDQQYAGLFMKVGAGMYLWAIILFVFFRWALRQERADRRFNLVRIEDGLAYRLPGETSSPTAAPAMASAGGGPAVGDDST